MQATELIKRWQPGTLVTWSVLTEPQARVVSAGYDRDGVKLVLSPYASSHGQPFFFWVVINPVTMEITSQEPDSEVRAWPGPLRYSVAKKARELKIPSPRRTPNRTVDRFNRDFPPGTRVKLSALPPGIQDPSDLFLQSVPGSNAWVAISATWTVSEESTGGFEGHVHVQIHQGLESEILRVNAITKRVDGQSDGVRRIVPDITARAAVYLHKVTMPKSTRSDTAPPTNGRSPLSPRLRMDVFIRDRFTCRLCGAVGGPSSSVQLEADHVVPVARGGTNDPENLQTLCKPCNQGKVDRPGFA